MDRAELLDRLKALDEVLLLELLQLTSEDICDAFLDRIAEYEDNIRRSLED